MVSLEGNQGSFSCTCYFLEQMYWYTAGWESGNFSSKPAFPLGNAKLSELGSFALAGWDGVNILHSGLYGAVFWI